MEIFGLFKVTEHTVHAARADLCYEAEPDQMMNRAEGVRASWCSVPLVIPPSCPSFLSTTLSRKLKSPPKKHRQQLLLYACFKTSAVIELTFFFFFFARYISNECNWSQISGNTAHLHRWNQRHGVKLCSKKNTV